MVLLSFIVGPSQSCLCVCVCVSHTHTHPPSTMFLSFIVGPSQSYWSVCLCLSHTYTLQAWCFSLLLLIHHSPVCLSHTHTHTLQVQCFSLLLLVYHGLVWLSVCLSLSHTHRMSRMELWNFLLRSSKYYMQWKAGLVTYSLSLCLWEIIWFWRQSFKGKKKASVVIHACYNCGDSSYNVDKTFQPRLWPPRVFLEKSFDSREVFFNSLTLWESAALSLFWSWFESCLIWPCNVISAGPFTRPHPALWRMVFGELHISQFQNPFYSQQIFFSCMLSSFSYRSTVKA